MGAGSDPCDRVLAASRGDPGRPPAELGVCRRPPIGRRGLSRPPHESDVLAKTVVGEFLPRPTTRREECDHLHSPTRPVASRVAMRFTVPDAVDSDPRQERRPGTSGGAQRRPALFPVARWLVGLRAPQISCQGSLEDRGCRGNPDSADRGLGPEARRTRRRRHPARLGDAIRYVEDETTAKSGCWSSEQTDTHGCSSWSPSPQTSRPGSSTPTGSDRSSTST